MKADFFAVKAATDDNYMPVFNRKQIAFTHGEGCTLFDTEGEAYTDFAAGIAVNSLGYNDPQLVAAISAQAAKLTHMSNLFYNDTQSALIAELVEGTDFDKVFLSNSGAEANECAIKLVRKYFYNKGACRPVILTALNSFHGRTLATATATGQTKYSHPFAPLPEGFRYVKYNDIAVLQEQAADPTVGAIMLETIQGEGGVIPATPEYMQAAEQLCRKYGLLLVIDEVQTGAGRTGKMFSYQHYGIKPDIITLAKGLGGGVPIGATLASASCANAFVPGDHGSTFGGNPLACAAARVVLQRLKGGLTEQAAVTGEYLRNALSSLVDGEKVLSVNGKGLMLGLRLHADIDIIKVIDKMLKSCYIIIGCGNNTLRFVPPLIISAPLIDNMIEALRLALAD